MRPRAKGSARLRSCHTGKKRCKRQLKTGQHLATRQYGIGSDLSPLVFGRTGATGARSGIDVPDKLHSREEVLMQLADHFFLGVAFGKDFHDATQAWWVLVRLERVL